MKVEMKPISVIITNHHIEPNGKVHAYFTAMCAKHMDVYVPKREGKLRETVVKNGQVTRNVTTDRIIYTQPYARYQFYGERRDGSHKVVNYTTAGTGRRWDRKMATVDGHILSKEIDNFVKRGYKE